MTPTASADPLACCYREQVAYRLYAALREPTLYRMAGVPTRWTAMPRRCRSHPREAAFRHRFAPNDTALHRLLRTPVAGDAGDDRERQRLSEAQLRAVEALLVAEPSLAGTRDAFGRTPLHLACLGCAEADDALSALVDALLSADAGAAAATQDVEGRTPLHYLLLRGRPPPAAAVRRLVEVCPAAVGLEDAVRECPLDVCMRRSSSIRNLQVATSGDELLRLLKAVPQDQRPRVAWQNSPQRRLLATKPAEACPTR